MQQKKPTNEEKLRQAGKGAFAAAVLTAAAGILAALAGDSKRKKR